MILSFHTTCLIQDIQLLRIILTAINLSAGFSVCRTVPCSLGIYCLSSCEGFQKVCSIIFSFPIDMTCRKFLSNVGTRRAAEGVPRSDDPILRNNNFTKLLSQVFASAVDANEKKIITHKWLLSALLSVIAEYIEEAPNQTHSHALIGNFSRKWCGRWELNELDEMTS